MVDTSAVNITVNGRRHSLTVGSNMMLLDLLRDNLRLCGPKAVSYTHLTLPTILLV